MRIKVRTTPTYWANDICNMADTCSACGTEIQNFHARGDENMLESTEHTSSQLAPEWIPYTIFDLGALHISVHRYPFFTINSFTWNETLGDQQMFFSFGDEHSSMCVRF